MTTPEPLIAHLDTVRRDRGITLAEWSRRAGVCESTIRQVISGRAGGGLVTAQALAGVLDLEVWAVPRPATTRDHEGATA